MNCSTKRNELMQLGHPNSYISLFKQQEDLNQFSLIVTATNVRIITFTGYISHLGHVGLDVYQLPYFFLIKAIPQL